MAIHVAALAIVISRDFSFLCRVVEGVMVASPVLAPFMNQLE